MAGSHTALKRIAGLGLILVMGVALIMIGRLTVSRGPAIEVPELSLEERCTGTKHRQGSVIEEVRVELRFRSGVPPGSGEGVVRFGMAVPEGSLEDQSRWYFNMEDSLGPPRLLENSEWFGLGTGGIDPATESARGWNDAVAEDSGWEQYPAGLSLDESFHFYGRQASGTLIFERFSSEGQRERSDPFDVRIAFFDVSGLTIDRELFVMC